MSEETTTVNLSEEEKMEMEAVRKERLLHIFSELYKSKRYADFVDNNFNIVDQIDDENKTITTLVIEKPIAVGPKLSPSQIMRLQSVISSSGAKSTADTLKQILEVLGQEGNVILANENDLSKIRQ